MSFRTFRSFKSFMSELQELALVSLYFNIVLPIYAAARPILCVALLVLLLGMLPIGCIVVRKMVMVAVLDKTSTETIFSSPIFNYQ